MAVTNQGAFSAIFDRWKRVKNTAGALLSPASLVRFMDGLDAVYDPASEEIRVSLNGGLGFVVGTRKLLTPSGSGLTIDGGTNADLSADRTFQIVVDNTTLKILGNTVRLFYNISSAPDENTVARRTALDETINGVAYGTGVLAATRYIAGTVDDLPATAGAVGVPTATVGLAFRDANNTIDLKGVEHESGVDGDTIVVGNAVVDASWGAAETDVRARTRVRLGVFDDGLAPVVDFLGAASGFPQGPKMRWSGEIGVNVTQILPSTGTYQLWEPSGPTLLALFDANKSGTIGVGPAIAWDPSGYVTIPLLVYPPGDPSFDGDPIVTTEAIRRIAAAVAGLLGGPIP